MTFLGTVSFDQIVLAIIATIVLHEVVTAILPDRLAKSDGALGRPQDKR